MATGRNRRRQEETELKTEAKTQTAAAVAPSELQQLQEKNTLSFLNDWTSGKDVKDIKELSPYLNLYEGAKNQQSAERLGGGLFNASGSNTSGLATAITAQSQARKEQEASGQLMNAANSAYQYASGVLAPSLIGERNQRMQFGAGMANQRLSSYYQRPQKPNPWLGLLQTGLGAAGQAAGAGLFG